MGTSIMGNCNNSSMYRTTERLMNRLDKSGRVPRMPQATNLKVAREKEFCPVGPGTVFNQIVDISAATRARAMLVNKVEDVRLQKIQRMIDKEHRFKNNLQTRVIDRTSKTLKEKQALLQLLSHDYKFDNFVTMRPGFDSNEIDTKHVARRYVMESRVFNSGFNMTALRPEVHRRIRKLDPSQKYRTFKKKLLADNRERNVEINRAISNSAFRRMLHDREHWRDYNDPNDRPAGNTADELSDNNPITEQAVVNLNDAPDALKTETIDNVQGADSDKEKAIGEPKERSIVLERRLPRRPADAFGSMTMRTLGPVYFQASVHTELPDIKA